ncbi:MAG: hypothetical protein HQK64_01520 [Desulfamplus sp.]|nr:hypothetical protein [Desulfamplus sp.]MBF0388915.1 hypothetical protein [Desulfamplus sp.]
MLKWIIKLRPIQTSPKIRPTKAILLANEIYSIFVALNHLSIDKDQISNGYYKNLLYTLHNRNLDGEILSSLMYLLEKSVNQKVP